jgi:hypothetical protein
MPYFGGTTDRAATINELPPEDPWTKWFCGVGLAVAISIGAAGYLWWRGLVVVCPIAFLVGLIVHFHWFWGQVPKLMGVSLFAKNVAAGLIFVYVGILIVMAIG